MYLELRTGPKAFKSCGSTAEQYLGVIRECITELNSPHHRMYVKLILSVKRTLAEARTKDMVMEQIDQVIELSKKNADLVVGMDICGNPEDATMLSNIVPALLDRQSCF